MNLFPFFEYNIAYLRFFYQFFPKLCHIVLQKYVPHLCLFLTTVAPAVNKNSRIMFDNLHRITYKNCFTRFRLAQMEQTADKNRKSTRSNLELKFKPLVIHNGFDHGSCDSLVDDHDEAPQFVTEAVSEKTFFQSQTRFGKTRVSLVKSFF